MKYIKLFEQFIGEKKPKDAPGWHDADYPDANGRFKDLSIKDLAAWLIDTRNKDVKAISGALTQQIVFNRNEDPDYAEKLEKTRKEVYKQLGREDLLREDWTAENPDLERVRRFQGTVSDMHSWLSRKLKEQGLSGETNPYKDTIMVNGPHMDDKDNSMPYQDFQNGKSDLVKYRHGTKTS